MRIVVRRTAGIGDCLAASIVAQRLFENGHSVEFQCHSITHAVMKRVPNLDVTIPNSFCHVNLDGAYENHPGRFTTHFYELLFQAANAQLRMHGYGPIWENAGNAKPEIRVYEKNRTAMQGRFFSYPKPWIMVCPQSHYNTRHVPDSVWSQVKLPGTLFWLGQHPAPAGYVDLKVKTLDYLCDCLSVADLLIAVDTGPMHIAAAMNVPIVAIKQAFDPRLRLPMNTHWAIVSPELDCLNCQKHKCPINAALPPCQQVDPSKIGKAVREMLDLSLAKR